MLENPRKGKLRLGGKNLTYKQQSLDMVPGDLDLSLVILTPLIVHPSNPYSHPFSHRLHVASTSFPKSHHISCLNPWPASLTARKLTTLEVPRHPQNTSLSKP